MKRFGKTTGIILCAALLALALGTSAALAYFSDYEPAKGKVTLQLQGENELIEGQDSKEKNIQIVAGEENGLDVIARVAIYGPEEFTYITADSEVWIDGGDGWYYYNGVLGPGETTPKDALIAKVADKDGKDLTKEKIAEIGDSFQITVVQESEIATYTQNDEGKNVVQSPEGWKLPTIVVD